MNYKSIYCKYTLDFSKCVLSSNGKTCVFNSVLPLFPLVMVNQFTSVRTKYITQIVSPIRLESHSAKSTDFSASWIKVNYIFAFPVYYVSSIFRLCFLCRPRNKKSNNGKNTWVLLQPISGLLLSLITCNWVQRPHKSTGVKAKQRVVLQSNWRRFFLCVFYIKCRRWRWWRGA